MAFTQHQTIADSVRRHVFKRVNYANSESSALLVNASALNCATSTITLTAGSNTFQVGECINAASGGSATVRQVVNTTAVQVSNATGTFTASTTLTGNVTGYTRVQSGSVSADTKQLQVSRIIYNTDIAGKVQLDWQGDGTSNHRTIAILSGSGVLELDTHGARANNTAINPTGNITISTLDFGANSHYTLIVDISKMDGYGVPVTGGW